MGVAEKDRTELADVLVATIGLLVGGQWETNVLDEVGNAFRLVGDRRRRPEFVLNGDQPNPAGEALDGIMFPGKGLPVVGSTGMQL